VGSSSSSSSSLAAGGGDDVITISTMEEYLSFKEMITMVSRREGLEQNQPTTSSSSSSSSSSSVSLLDDLHRSLQHAILEEQSQLQDTTTTADLISDVNDDDDDDDSDLRLNIRQRELQSFFLNPCCFCAVTTPTTGASITRCVCNCDGTGPTVVTPSAPVLPPSALETPLPTPQPTRGTYVKAYDMCQRHCH
jgi:hypothetical protein